MTAQVVGSNTESSSRPKLPPPMDVDIRLRSIEAMALSMSGCQYIQSAYVLVDGAKRVEAYVRGEQS